MSTRIVGTSRLGAAALLGAVALLAAGCGDDKIDDGVRVGQVDVGGLKTDAARERVQRGLADAFRKPVT